MEAAQWPGSYNIAVNLSPLQFKDPHLVETVREALKSSGLAPERLELEINETVLLSDTPAVLTTLHQFHDLGVRVALDDFGAGYSSLSCLRRFPFDKIKIDRSFVNDLGPDRRANAIIRAVTGLSASLGMITTAEGIETVDQLMRVRQEGCTEVQGLLIGRPKPVGEIAGLIHAAEYPQKETVVQSGTFKQ
jgi:EAL domain-containing protein (putative c-di-GMP-specific phosphodiesterase class I)